MATHTYVPREPVPEERGGGRGQQTPGRAPLPAPSSCLPAPPSPPEGPPPTERGGATRPTFPECPVAAASRDPIPANESGGDARWGPRETVALVSSSDALSSPVFSACCVMRGGQPPCDHGGDLVTLRRQRRMKEKTWALGGIIRLSPCL